MCFGREWLQNSFRVRDFVGNSQNLCHVTSFTTGGKSKKTKYHFKTRSFKNDKFKAVKTSPPSKSRPLQRAHRFSEPWEAHGPRHSGALHRGWHRAAPRRQQHEASHWGVEKPMRSARKQLSCSFFWCKIKVVYGGIYSLKGGVFPQSWKLAEGLWKGLFAEGLRKRLYAHVYTLYWFTLQWFCGSLAEGSRKVGGSWTPFTPAIPHITAMH